MPTTPLFALHEALGARLEEHSGWGMPADYGDPAGEHRAGREGAVLMDLSHRGKLRLSGSDAAKFLQGMLSNRVEELSPGEGVYNTFLTRRGKFVADMHLYRRENDFAADLPPGLASVFAEAIDMYIIMDQVEVEEVTESLCGLGLFGPASARCLKEAGLGAEGLAEHGHRDVEGVHIARELWTGEDGYLLWAPPERAEALWTDFSNGGARPAGTTAFGTMTLEAGTRLFGVDMDSNINPMQAGLETTAIDFEKGCYIGQEVIAKIKYLGQVNRGLAGICLEGNLVPSRGAQVEMNGEEVGTLTRAAYCPTLEHVAALGLIHRKAMEPGTALSVREGGKEISAEVAPLPFFRNPALEIQA